MNNRIGITCMLVHGFLVSILFILGKLHQENIDVMSMILLYSLSTLPIITFFICIKDIRLFYTKRASWYLLRSVLQSLGFINYFYGLSLMEVGFATALSFLTPIISSLMASFIYKQHLSSKQFFMLLVGFIGILIIINPTVSINNGILFIIASAFFWASCDMVTIKIGEKESIITQIFYMVIFSILFCSIVSPGSISVAMEPNNYNKIIFLMSFLYVLQSASIMKAIQTTPLEYIMPIDYLRLPISIAMGAYFFGETIGINIYIGSCLVFISSIITILTSREKIKNQ